MVVEELLLVEGRILAKGSVTISSGVDNKGEVEVDTPPKLFIMLLVRFNDAVDVERTSRFPFGTESEKLMELIAVGAD